MNDNIKEIKKTLYYWPGANFGDVLNKYLFEKVFRVRFNYSSDIWAVDYYAIGSILEYNSLDTVMCKISFIKQLFLLKKIKLSKLTILGSGFLNCSDEHKIKFLRNMDFKIVRGKLTENYLKKYGFLTKNVLLGDLGLLCSFMVDKIDKKYKLGIVPHYMDLNSPVIYDVYKKYGKDKCIIINVQDDVETVISQIAACDNIISSSLHGLIVADSFNIPNLWFENTLKYHNSKSNDMLRFKFRDYYSIYGINEIEPINILDIIDLDTNMIINLYNVNYNLVKRKQQELYDYCKTYFESI